MMSIVSSKGIFVNNDLISKLHIVKESDLIFKLSNSWTEEKESFTMCGPEEIGRKRGTKNLETTREKVPIEERIGLRGTPGLWIFGKPYKIPGRKPEGNNLLFICQ